MNFEKPKIPCRKAMIPVVSVQQYGQYVIAIKAGTYQSGKAADYTNTDTMAGHAITKLSLETGAMVAEKIYEGIDKGCDPGGLLVVIVRCCSCALGPHEHVWTESCMQVETTLEDRHACFKQIVNSNVTARAFSNAQVTCGVSCSQDSYAAEHDEHITLSFCIMLLRSRPIPPCCGLH